jgi:uncharacterized protein YndB with AHSA1/START domain
MSNKPRSAFGYVTYIRTTPAKLWSALTDPEVIKQYWFNMRVECDWRVGSAYKLVHPDGRLDSSGEILESDPPRRLVYKWLHEVPELKVEGHTRCTMLVEPAGKGVKLSITHDIERSDSKFIALATGSWPKIMSNLKSLLETGELVLLDYR